MVVKVWGIISQSSDRQTIYSNDITMEIKDFGATDMGYNIKQIGHNNGDKYLKGVVPNMKVGELRYYPQDNPNLYRVKSGELSPETVVRIFKEKFLH